MSDLNAGFFNYIERHWRKIIFCVILASFLVSLSYSFYFRIQPSVDAGVYDSIAWDIAQGKGYDKTFSISRPGPGYEYFLAFIYSIFGHNYPAVWIIQSLLLSLTAFLVFRLTRLIYKENWHPLMGIAAAALVGFSPDLITVASMLLTETFMIFLAVASVFLFFKYIESGRLYFVPLTAIFIALTALTRGSALLLFFPVLVYFLVKKEWGRALLFFIVLVLCLTPWTIRNYKVYGELRPFNSGTGALLATGNYPGASGELEPHFKWPEGYDTLPQIEFDKVAMRDGFNFISSHPFQFAKLTLLRISIYFSFARPTGWWYHLEGIFKVATLVGSAAYSVIIFIFGFLGAWLAFKKADNPILKSRAKYLLGFIIMLPIPILMLVVETRYRFPVYPFLAVFAGYGVFALVKNFKPLIKSVLFISGPFILNTLFDILRNWQRILDRISGL